MKLRDYQERAVSAVIEKWKTRRSCLIVLPTGCGKTVVFGEVIRRRLADTGRAMILAHREELIHQAADKVAAIAGRAADIEMGAYESNELDGLRSPIVVSTVQTQVRARMEKFDPSEFTTLVIDEAHHATASTYRRCVEHYFANPDCRLLGVTATPDRADETALGSVFEDVAFEYPMQQAIEDGWLVPVRQKLVTVGTLDFSKVHSVAGDFNQGELSEILEQEENLHAIARPTVDICGKRRAIVFAASVNQAKALAIILNRYGDEGKEAEGQGGEGGGGRVRAEWLCGKTPKKDRSDILDRFRRGEVQFVVNVGVLTEGFDDAGVEVVVMARPTKSRALYAQMAGRATRPAAEIAAKLGECGGVIDTALPEPADTAGRAVSMKPPHVLRRALIAASSKPSCLIIDFVGNSGRHKLVSTIDILGGKELDPDERKAREIARRRLSEGEGGDTVEELRKAREEVEREKARQRERELREERRKSFIAATAQFVTTSVDPFNTYDLTAPVTTAKPNGGRVVSPALRNLIRYNARMDPDKMTWEQANAIRREIYRRSDAHLATIPQSALLFRKGVMVPMRFEEARRTIDRLVNQPHRARGW